MKTYLLEDIFNAYFEARKNKRNTLNALAFEINYETKLFQLYEEIKNDEYKILPSICFINFLPIKREIFDFILYRKWPFEIVTYPFLE